MARPAPLVAPRRPRHAISFWLSAGPNRLTAIVLCSGDDSDDCHQLCEDCGDDVCECEWPQLVDQGHCLAVEWWTLEGDLLESYEPLPAPPGQELDQVPAAAGPIDVWFDAGWLWRYSDDRRVVDLPPL